MDGEKEQLEGYEVVDENGELINMEREDSNEEQDTGDAAERTDKSSVQEDERQTEEVEPQIEGKEAQVHGEELQAKEEEPPGEEEPQVELQDPQGEEEEPQVEEEEPQVEEEKPQVEEEEPQVEEEEPQVDEEEPQVEKEESLVEEERQVEKVEQVVFTSYESHVSHEEEISPSNGDREEGENQHCSETNEMNGHWTEMQESGDSSNPEQDVKNIEEVLAADVLSSEAFRKQIQDIVIEQLMSCGDGGKLQPLTDLLTLQQRFGNGCGSLTQVVQICDIRGTDCLNYTKQEKVFRCKLASLYRLLDLFGWVSNLHDNITACFTENSSHMLVIPRGMMFDEVTASSLVKVDLEGNVVDSGTTNLGIDVDCFRLDRAIHRARTDVKCVVHLTCPTAYSVSVMKSGLLPLSPEAMMLGEISYFEFTESMYDDDEHSGLVEKLGARSKVLVLRNYGIIVCGETVEESFCLASYVMSAVDTQLSLIKFGVENLRIPSEELCQQMHEGETKQSVTTSTREVWKRGEREFEAMMRQLDSAGYYTGYVYHELTSNRLARVDRVYSDVGLVSSTKSGAYYNVSNDRFNSPAPMKMSSRDSKHDTRGVSPSPYLRGEEPTSGRTTPNPKIARWLSESPTPARMFTPTPRPESANQFAPRGINPIELREKVKEIRKDYYTDKVTAGPQSRILDGITWDEAKVIKAPDGHVSGTTDNFLISASKGIIQREHQHTVVGYKKYEPPNPFNAMSEEDIDKYRQDVDVRVTNAGDHEPREVNLEPGPNGCLISSEERLNLIRQSHGDSNRRTDVVSKHGEEMDCSEDK